MTGVKSKCGKAPQASINFSSDNTSQLNGISCLPIPPLNKVLKSCLYTSHETITRPNSLAQTAAETKKDYYGQTKNAVPIDVTPIKESQSTNTMDGDNLTNCLRTSSILAGMEVVRKSLGFFSKFDWSKCEWRLLNKRKTMHALALKGEAGLGWLWFIGTIEYAGLTISKFDGWTIKIRLSEEDYTELKRRLIQHGILLFV